NFGVFGNVVCSTWVMVKPASWMVSRVGRLQSQPTTNRLSPFLRSCERERVTNAAGWLPGSVPPQRERERGGDEKAAEAGEPRGDVAMLVDDRERAGEVAEGGLELVGVLRAVEPAAGDAGDLPERVVVGDEGVAPAKPAAVR